jgi:chromosome segregation ATPase
MTEKAPTKLPWTPTWCEKQMVTNNPEISLEDPPYGKCKKTNQPNTSNSAIDNSTVHHAHTQQTEKILSIPHHAEDATRYESMKQDIADLRERTVELTSMVGEMNDIQHRNQIKITGLQSDLEATTQKVETGAKDIRKVKTSLTSVETRLASLFKLRKRQSNN